MTIKSERFLHTERLQPNTLWWLFVQQLTIKLPSYEINQNAKFLLHKYGMEQICLN